MGKRLYDLVRGYRTLSIAGMCKNAGKTTALGSILSNCPDGETIALTSIGRDGESEDVLTGAPKPAINIRKGSIYATAEELLPKCEPRGEALTGTGVFTPLGEVLILRAPDDGKVELAGPSMVTQLVGISQLFLEYGADRIIIDGAMGRKSLCSRSLSEAAILCAGAACGDNIDEVVAGTAHVCRLLMTPEDRDAAAEIGLGYRAKKLLLVGNGNEPFPDGADLAAALKYADKPRLLYIEGAVTDRMIEPLLHIKLPSDFRIIARDASKLLLSAVCATRFLRRGGRFGVLEGIRLAAITINPYAAFGNSFDNAEFLEKMAVAVPVPVINVITDDCRLRKSRAATCRP